jgi:c-di-GMP-binding flagellar brake protein YcgR
MNRRTAHRAKVDLLINRFLDGHPYMCRVTDISTTGLRLVPLLEPKGDHRYMGIQLQLPGTDTIVTASAEAVTDADGTLGTGVRFTSLAPESERALRRFLEAN